MKRLHVHLAVTDLDASVRFYSALFSAAPTVLKADYAKWMVDDPRVNFAVSTRGHGNGVDHFGIQCESDGELQDVCGSLQTAGVSIVTRGETSCCYARSEKSWAADPTGICWETFLTRGPSPGYGSDRMLFADDTSSVCCTRPKPADAQFYADINWDALRPTDC